MNTKKSIKFLTESKPEEIFAILEQNGIDEEYFEGMGGMEIESGGDEWMSVIEDITGEDPYGELSEKATVITEIFIKKLYGIGVELI